MRIVVTGGLGFIGSSFVDLCKNLGYEVLVVDKETYAANIDWLADDTDCIIDDICNTTEFDLEEYDYLVNFAAESHVDNSIKDGKPFVKTNVEGTYNLLELARKNKNLKKFVQISTDEVYGDLDMLNIDASFEQNFLYPSSYYSATKASADMLVYSCGHTYGLPYIITRTCNNFGIRQHKEKFIPTIINSIKNDKPIPVYGDGKQIREWIWVEDNVKQILKLMLEPDTGTFNIGSGDCLQNIDIIKHIGDLIGKEPKYEFVKDRLGHDRRYTLDTDFVKPKITKTLFEYLEERI
jgi:dTDP-glucose 4,6-dehydratase|tara:strand:- start:1243 stop:2124 length:882 start_codon:yes stop_codon:yes gene_type:complete